LLLPLLVRRPPPTRASLRGGAGLRPPGLPLLPVLGQRALVATLGWFPPRGADAPAALAGGRPPPHGLPRPGLRRSALPADRRTSAVPGVADRAVPGPRGYGGGVAGGSTGRGCGRDLPSAGRGARQRRGSRLDRLRRGGGVRAGLEDHPAALLPPGEVGHRRPHAQPAPQGRAPVGGLPGSPRQLIRRPRGRDAGEAAPRLPLVPVRDAGLGQLAAPRRPPGPYLGRTGPGCGPWSRKRRGGRWRPSGSCSSTPGTSGRKATTWSRTRAGGGPSSRRRAARSARGARRRRRPSEAELRCSRSPFRRS
jgi:hypothetical protein